MQTNMTWTEHAPCGAGAGCALPPQADACAAVESFLRRYQLDHRMLQAEMRRRARREQLREAGQAWAESGEGGALFCRARMYEVQEFIRSLPDGEEKLFLYDHYILGESVVRIAEDLDISDRSAYRLRRRALTLAAGHYRRRHTTAGFSAVLL